MTEKQPVIVTYLLRRQAAAEFWIDVDMDGALHGSVGPFSTRDKAIVAYEDLAGMVRELGGIDMPVSGH